jgi:cytochrome c oxidase cbb3-type subunit 3
MDRRLRRRAQSMLRIFCGLALMLSVLSSAAPALAQDAGARSDQDLARGRMLYVASCARCHGVNGGGGEGPPLARERLPRAPDEASLLFIMTEGIEGTAMSGSWWLSETEQRQVAAYVRSLAPSGASAGDRSVGDATHGRELFERGRCAGCHTVGGFGTARGPDLTELGLRRGAAYLREAILDPAAALPKGLTALPSDFSDYLMVRLVDADGTEVRGMRMNEDSYTIQLKDGRGNLHSFYKPELRELEKQFDRSLMRSFRDTFTDAEVEDLVSYLMTLTGADPRLIL